MVLNCRADMPLECVTIKCAGPEPSLSASRVRCIRRSRRDRSLTTAAIALEGECPALQRGGAIAAAGRTHEAVWPATFE